jgi:N-carbamoylputrescine amidase
MRCSSDPDANLQRAVAGIESAAEKGAQVICLPELFRSLYFCQVEDAALFDLAETIPGPSTERLSELARQLGVVLVVPLFEKRAPGLYHNSAVVIDADGELVGRYRKMHIPDDPNFYEKFYFTPGDLGFPTFDTRFGRIGVLICWDQWFPEAARLSALAGAQILFYPTAIGWHAHEKESHGVEQHRAWETVQRGHAVANGLFVAAVNRVGVEGSLEFWGRSFLVDPMGTHLALADDSEQVLVVDCDFERIEQIRRGWPFLRDRRIDAYAPLQKRLID